MERAVAGPQDTGGKRGCQESAGGAHRLDPTEGPEGSVPRAVLGPSPRPAPDLTKDPWKSVHVRQLVGFLRRPPLQGPGCPRGSDRTGARPEKSDQERLLGARRPSPQQTGQARIHAVPWDGERREGGHSRAGAEHGAQRGHLCQNLRGPWRAEAVGLSFLIWRPKGDGGGGLANTRSSFVTMVKTAICVALHRFERLPLMTSCISTVTLGSMLLGETLEPHASGAQNHGSHFRLRALRPEFSCSPHIFRGLDGFVPHWMGAAART